MWHPHEHNVKIRLKFVIERKLKGGFPIPLPSLIPRWECEFLLRRRAKPKLNYTEQRSFASKGLPNVINSVCNKRCKSHLVRNCIGHAGGQFSHVFLPDYSTKETNN